MLDFEAWRCCHDDRQFCPPEGCPLSYGCARDHGWKPGDPEAEIERLRKEADRSSEHLAAIGNENTKLHVENETLQAASFRDISAFQAIRAITGDTHCKRPYTALSEIDQIARKALA